MNGKWKAFFAGDVLIKHPIDGRFISDELYNITKDCDIVSCNFEAPIEIEDQEPITKAGSHIFQLPEAPLYIKNAGFNVISLANNHMYDYGRNSLKATIESLDGMNVIGAGLGFDEAYEMKVIEVKGTKVGLLAFCESEFGAIVDEWIGNSGYAWVNHKTVNSKILKAKNEVDILIVQVHAGVELIDIPLPEWRSRYKELIDCGVDVLIAHHPHVPQGWETYNDKLIFYSLGNFYFDLEYDHELWYKGYAVLLNFNGSILDGFEVIPTEKVLSEVTICKQKAYKEYLNSLNELLALPQYKENVNRVVLELWERVYRDYYAGALDSSSLYKSYKKILYLLFCKLVKKDGKPFNYVLLLHNIRIESHRWCVERALSLLAEHS